MYRVEVTEKAYKALKKIPPFHAQVILQKVQGLKNYHPLMSNVKALKGEFQGVFRLRVGDYRVIFEMHQKVLAVLVIDIFHRGKGY